MVAHPLLFLMEMLAIILILYSSFVFAKLDTQEGEVLKEILEKLGMGEWSFGKDPCSRVNPKFDNVYVECLCPFKNNTTCHIINMNIKNQNLSSGLPLEFTKLRYLRILDLSRNYLSGSVPSEWANMRLSNLSLMGNRLSGPFPKTLTRMTTLVDLSIEGNRFSGPIPGEIANLKNLTKLVISSNDFTGQLPVTLANLTNLTDMRINDNNFTGKIPNFIGQWTKIEKLYIQGCSLEGPFPYSSISALTQLVDLRISDLKGGAYSKFPQLEKMTNLKKLLLRNCLIHGTIPEYIGNMKLEALDLSFNNFSGRIPQSFSQLRNAKYIYLTQNNLSGTIPEWVFTSTKDVDVSYNQFIWDASHPHMCAQGFVNMVQSHSSAINDGTNILPCLRKDFPCNKSNDQLAYSMFINCGGEEVYINNTLKYKEDLESKLTPYYDGGNWAFSSTGNFLDDSGDDVYIISNTSNLHNISTSDTKLFINARTAAISLTYYGLCLLNGNYNLTLYFAEIVFSQDKSYNSLGKRVFDVYVQGELKIKDFDIVKEAGGTGRAVLKKYTVNVQKNTLKIQLYWAGKGTTCIPKRGSYGPIISAISVEPNFKPPNFGKKTKVGLIAGTIGGVLFFVVLIISILWRKGYIMGGKTADSELRASDLEKKNIFTYKQIQAATKNFDPLNKLGKGGFGSVFKGVLLDGTIIAVKQLSDVSKQGAREFVNEIGILSAARHPNLIRIYGCCAEGSQLLLIYEYMENNSLSHALLGNEKRLKAKLTWPVRFKICLGIARGLVYLHEESQLKIIHRDIKASNVLLDEDFNAKISDFGLAKLHDDQNTHVTTRVVGTMSTGYFGRGKERRIKPRNKSEDIS
ncbi:putative protein kinase RLK-Pelle-DLSV family [Helianthus annuus]|nr:putative protein kinase RLK-Pelle-DLSV family [Helianthus annuus]